ncbi:hypothetical protein N8E89_14635 [Phyllobacterium sp. A18/5-2]|uniref:hypothetical protein n=1 Tax=Phyllobacterium sp. A18/5-2 TaxID=2978392 RepID=UPI0021C6AD85|nr:hypothetical protein [Phyllobacterium sp. A18/5-2]UXN63752.1 hypothetical protein N8E89_14635 [Phyllobacterium sp. A18/5-2]
MILSRRLERDEYAFEATLNLLRQRPGINGLYIAGGGIEGVLKAVREAGRERTLPIVGHDLTETTARGLIDGTLKIVLSHPIDAIAKGTVELLVERSLQPQTGWQYAHQNYPMQIFSPESL